MPSAHLPPSALLALHRPVPDPARRATAAALAALALTISTAACGQGRTPGEDRSSVTASGSSSVTASGTPAGSATEPSGTASEVRLARVGGVAGFQDVLVVAPDGRVTGTTRSGPVDCSIPAATVRVLATAAPPTTGLNDGNDRIAASVERDGTTLDLGEAQGADPLSTAARELLDDVQLPQDQRAVCT